MAMKEDNNFCPQGVYVSVALNLNLVQSFGPSVHPSILYPLSIHGFASYCLVSPHSPTWLPGLQRDTELYVITHNLADSSGISMASAAMQVWTKSWTQLSNFTFFLSVVPFGEGNGNLFQCSFLENPMDRGSWRATVYGVARVGHY